MSAPLFTGVQAARWLAEALGGGVTGYGDLERAAIGLTTDSRTLVPGACFLALTGERFDGNAFVAAALGAGAAGVIATRVPDPPAGAWAIEVAETRAALAALAGRWRRRLATPVVAITGSCGKTTTREMVRAMGAAAGLATLASEANFNNEIGCPLTLLALRPYHRLGVVELGMNHPGEIGALARTTAPDVAAITRIGAAHLAGVGDLAGVIAAKGELLEAMAAGRPVVLNRDDPAWEVLAARARGPILSFGRHPEATVRWRRRGGRVHLVAAGEEEVVALPPGDHLAEDAACAAACGLALALPLAVAAAALTRFRPLPGRGARLSLPGGGELLDESYNANPDSMDAALAVLAAGPLPRVAVLGDMYELGAAATELHRALGEQAAERCDHLIAVGAHAAEVVAGAGTGEAVADWEAALEALQPHLAGEPTILVKGSRALRLDRLVDALGEACLSNK